MAKAVPVIFMMFGIVMVSLIVLGISSYYGTVDWTWIAQQNALLVLALIVLGTALFVLVEWVRGRR